MWQRTQYVNGWKLVVQYVMLLITPPLLVLIFSKSCTRYRFTHCVWMKSPKAADFPASNVAVEGVLYFMSGNVKAFLENVLHVQSSSGCWLKQNVVETVVLINIPGNWHPRIVTYSVSRICIIWPVHGSRSILPAECIDTELMAGNES